MSFKSFKCSIDSTPSSEINEKQRKENLMIKKQYFIHQCSSDFNHEYVIQDKLGQGSFGSVFKVLHKRLKEIRALKIVNKNPKRRFDPHEQLEMLKKLDHPNILKIYEYFQSQIHLYIITQYFQGKELFDQIVEEDAITEKKAAIITYEILKALRYIHSKNIAHRDIKAENVLVKKIEDQYIVKVIDWGLGSILVQSSNMRKCGTPQYCAPQVLKGQYDISCDMWSIGVLVYILLSGHFPFRGANIQQTLELVGVGKICFSHQLWDYISIEGKQFIRGLLKKNKKQRMSAQQALKHPWILGNINQTDQHALKYMKDTLEELKNCNIENKFHVIIIHFIHNYLSTNQQQLLLKKQFEMLDQDNDGTLSYQQLNKGYSKIYGEVEAKAIVDKIFMKIDLDNSGKIEYSEFITFATKLNRTYSIHQLKEAFRLFDRDNDGKISKNYEYGSGNEEIEKIINLFDKDQDGSIDFAQFLQSLNKTIQNAVNHQESYKQNNVTNTAQKIQDNQQPDKKNIDGIQNNTSNNEAKPHTTE